MKKCKISLLVALWMSLLAGGAQGNGLIISEYIEGSGNNKALEIYNGTGTSVALEDYSVRVYFNGATSAGASIALGGSLADGEVFVLAHSEADAAVLAEADQTYSGGLFNGDDAVALVGPDGFVDVIGQIGQDPGSQWGDSGVGTQNQTLLRKPDRLVGRSDGSGPFDPALEWDSAGLDNFVNLGQHTGGSGAVILGQCGDPATYISQIQGSAAASPLAGERHEVEAVVVGDFQDTASGLRGFFLQEEDGDQDGLDATSEGLFVYDSGFGVDVQVGDLVRVGGRVSEYYGLTELDTIDGVRVCGSGHSVTAAQISLPFASVDYPERYEGMLVEFQQTLTVSGNENLARYGELELSAGRLYIPTHSTEPGAAALAQQAANARNRIVLDDGSTTQNPEPVPYPDPGLSADNSLRAGSTVTGLKGVLSYGFDAYRLQPLEAPQFVTANPRTSAPALPGTGSLRVASMNVLNYFNGDGMGGGFPTSRGADTPEEFQRQRDKIISAILGTGADIIGLMEIENDGYGARSAIQDLVDGLNTASGGQRYAFVDPGLERLGADEIAVGIVYRADRVQPLGAALTLDSYPFDNLNRQPLLQAFTELASDQSVAVVVNHFKSKGSCPDDGSLNDDQNDGQGCWNQIRTEAATALADWLASDPIGADVAGVLILGDLNSYAQEHPITALRDAGYTDLLAAFHGGAAHSYVYKSQAGYLDYALADTELTPLVTGAEVWHINADEPSALDYNTEQKSEAQRDSLYSADPYRASDHDPLVIELDLRADNAAPSADFSAEVEGRQAQFTDRSSDSDGHIVGWHWDFGDGETSSEQNPSHRYREPGSYTVTLNVEDNSGARASAQRGVRVWGSAAELQAQFTMRHFLNWVRVRDHSGGEGNFNYHWDFGDGSTARGTHVWHRYERSGSYEITLTVRDSAGRKGSATRKIFIRRPWWWPF
ncbi:ExeM/NucH family extracellular endonuclease [Microbulbifer thermotolerans]|uniref:ExeM/NucH family extracellular endonuclease n=1 Tax=Microbulbifer thermotolerans TaxID=252514 RepID=UPI00224B6DE5|nr:ExeM/NucH family extracellular endonuclease [Microbulbifer thermotolerans]MCX2781695.1 ExeM/NucH family extracellular endonuclease [Microbulbifer thermotolerans]WKT61428.1 ExeM/NucH family extracellular endonuclease [Microbulbifer thermotolerans]